VQIGLADDAVLFREGMARLLVESGFEVAFQAANVDELMAALQHKVPDGVILDIHMPPTYSNEGLLAAVQIREQYPEIAVLLLSQYLEAQYAVRLLETGGDMVGYLLKERVTDIDQLRDALHRLGHGSTVIDPQVVADLLRRRRNADTLMTLTEREREVLELMAEGRSNKAIEKTLFLGQKTVETHISNIFQKLELASEPDDHRRVLAVLSYLRTT
jgi:DNA-binding NarL/FixJ family response regulator